MHISRAEILELIPHAGSMCLHDAVLEYDAETVLCSSQGHLSPRHPLRCNNELAALHLAEYGAQAMAIHGGLLVRAQGGRAAPGFLVSIRSLQLSVGRLDDLGCALHTRASRIMGGPGGWTYAFTAQSEHGQPLGSGRVTVVLLGEGK